MSGTAERVNEEKLAFNANGKVTKIYVKKGESVKKGKVLAEIDSGDIKRSIAQSELSLQNSRLKLAETKKGADESTLIKSRSDVETNESKLNNAVAERENLVLSQEDSIVNIDDQIRTKSGEIVAKARSIELEKQNLAVLEGQTTKEDADLATKRSNLINTNLDTLRKYLSDARNELYDIDVVFGITIENLRRNDDYETYISAKNPAYRNRVETSYGSVKSQLDTLENTINSIIPSSDTALDSVRTALVQAKTVHASLASMEEAASDAMKSSIAVAVFSQAIIDQNASSFYSAATAAKSVSDKIEASILSIDTFADPLLQQNQNKLSINKSKNSITELQTSLRNLQADLADLRRNREATIRSNEEKIRSKDLEIESAKTNFAYSKASNLETERGATYETILQSENDIKKQVLSLETTKKSLEDYQIIAPFDGVVDGIDYSVGDTASATKYVYLNNPSVVKLTALLDQLDVAKVKVGMTVRVVFDAFQSQTIEGKISAVDTFPVESSGVSSYTVTVHIDVGDLNILTGMTSKMTIVTASRENVLVVQSSYITKEGDRSFVLMGTGANAQYAEVKTGMSNATETEISQGLNEGDTVIKKVAITAKTSSQTSLFGTPGAGRAGGSSSNTRSNSSSSSQGGSSGGPPPGM